MLTMRENLKSKAMPIIKKAQEDQKNCYDKYCGCFQVHVYLLFDDIKLCNFALYRNSLIFRSLKFRF